MKPRSSAQAEPARVVGSVTVGGEAIPLVMRQSRRARAVSLRIDPADDAVQLVLPRGVSLREGLRFAAEKSAWLRTTLARRPPRVAFVPGARIPFLGRDHAIVHTPSGRAGVQREEGRILVSGSAEFVSRRLKDWLKREALRILDQRARAVAARVDRSVARVRIRDTKSRWGSCAPDGGLNFSWRLILAPDQVLDYVVAHEVAHLVHANHGERFWRLVEALAGDVETPRTWLRRHGDVLLRYG